MTDHDSQTGNPEHEIHPDWQAWMDASAFTHAEARKELGLANGTFYRRIAKAPSRIEQLAMRASFEGLEPIDYTDIPPPPKLKPRSHP